MTFSDLKIYYQNTRGLRTKCLSFYRQVSCENYDVIILTETWLNDSILSSELFDDRYVVYRRDRDKRKKDGGGVLIAVLRKINSIRMHQWESDCEDLWVIIDISITKSFHRLALCAVYLPPPVLRSNLEHYLDSCNTIFEQSDLGLCIVGDFNLGNIDWSLVSESDSGYMAPGIGHLLTDFSHINNLLQLNNIKNKSGRILDLVLTNLTCGTVCSASNPLSIIDSFHPPIDIHFKSYSDARLPYNRNKRINFYKLDYDIINAYLNEINWSILFNDTRDANDMLSIFYDKIKIGIEMQDPPTTHKHKSHPPWFDKNLIRTLREKERIRRRYRIYKNPMDELALKLLSKRCSVMAISCYNKYVSNLETVINKDPKRFWAYIKDKRGGSSSYPLTMTDGITSSSDGFKISEMFAVHFSSMFSQHNVTHPSSPSDYMRDMLAHSLPLMAPVIDSDTLLNKLKSLDHRKGAGPDGIPPYFISMCASSLVTPLLLIFNSSLATGIFPNIWKVAQVVPIHKCSDRNYVGNYRPISLLSTFAKVFESLICPYIQSHLSLYLSNSQHGFVSSRSTCTNLVTFTETLVDAIDSGKQVDVIYTDFSRAFDRVPHNILLYKLNAYGITGSLLEWFKSYLDGRTFFVALSGYRSGSYMVTSGVPQGSHVGPVLFNIFVNDLVAVLKYSECFMYADDLKFCRITESDLDIVLLQRDIDLLANWCDENGMTLNVNKCYHVKFTRKTKFIQSAYNINGIPVQEVEQMRDLGVLFDRQLTFVPHIENVVKKASRMLGFVIRNVSCFRRNKTKILLYNCLVRSSLEYCSTVWRPHYATHTLRLERVQKRFLWHLAFSSGVARKKRSYKEKLLLFKMITLQKRRDLLDSTFLFKILRSQIDCPQLLAKLKIRVPTKCPRAPITPLCPPFRRTVLGANSPISRLCTLLNSCSDLVDVHFDSLTRFRRSIMCKNM